MQMQSNPMKLNRSEKLFCLSVAVVCAMSAYFVFSSVHKRISPLISNRSESAMMIPDGGIEVETAIVGACSVGMPERFGASDIALAMNIAQCQEAAIANIQITNTTKKWHRNVEIACVELGYDGSMLKKSMLSIAEEIPPSATISVNGLALKTIDDKTARIECAILGAERF